MRYILIILSAILLTSCSTYKIQTSKPQISHVIAITNTGDTIQVPIEEFERSLTPQNYSGWNIYWNNSWWMYNDWYWNYWNRRVYTPRYYIYTPPKRVIVPQQPHRNYVPPQTQPKRVDPPVRGRSNQPQIRQTPRVQQPQSPIRRSVPNTTRGGRIIQQ